MLSKILMALTMVLTALHAPGTTSDVFAVGEHYLVVEPDGALTLWAESNGEGGLQMSAVVILGDVVSHPDTRLLI